MATRSNIPQLQQTSSISNPTTCRQRLHHRRFPNTEPTTHGQLSKRIKGQRPPRTSQTVESEMGWRSRLLVGLAIVVIGLALGRQNLVRRHRRLEQLGRLACHHFCLSRPHPSVCRDGRPREYQQRGMGPHRVRVLHKSASVLSMKHADLLRNRRRHCHGQARRPCWLLCALVGNSGNVGHRRPFSPSAQ